VPHRPTRSLATLSPRRLDIDWELNVGCYRSRDFAAACDDLGIGQRFTRPYRPQTNGKAEWVIQTLLAAWAYGRLYRSNEKRAAALPGFVGFYDRRRPHTALGGRSPSTLLTTSLEITPRPWSEGRPPGRGPGSHSPFDDLSDRVTTYMIGCAV